jgi:large-conductance mechanosensitive channel
LILLGIGLVVGRAIGCIVKKISEKIIFDHYWNRTGISESVLRAGWNLTRIISVAAACFAYLFFMLPALNLLRFQKLAQAINMVWPRIP